MRALLIASLGLCGCMGSVVGPPLEEWLFPGTGGGAAGGGLAIGGGPAGGGEEGPPARDLPSPSSRLARLSHQEYDNTVRDLLGASTSLGLSATFPATTTSTTFNNNGGDLTITSAQWQSYQTAAEEVARLATLNTTALTTVAGGSLPTEDEQLVAALGRRALRRALSASELGAYQALFDAGATAYPSMTPRLAGARILLEGLLQSPHFLYKTELSTAVTDDVVPLTPYEQATRLSYGLWQSMPDEALLRAAENGDLATPEGYAAQLTRLLEDSRARDTVQTFHAQLLEQSKYADITRSTTLFPEYTPTLPQSMRQEQILFLDDVLFEQQGNLATLLSAPTSFVDQNLARIYGLTGDFDDTFTRVTFTDGRRAGLFTQIGFLAAHANSTESDPIHRGVFVNRRVLCAPLPAPPNQVPPLPDATPGVPKTLRQRITEHTGEGTCGAGCHGVLINPIGFAYEHFDALGRWRTQDHGLPVDARDTYNFDGTRRSYDGASELANLMAAEPMAHRCYVRHWVEFLHGRAFAAADNTAVDRLGLSSARDGIPVTQLVRLIAESEAFRTRPVEVAP